MGRGGLLLSPFSCGFSSSSGVSSFLPPPPPLSFADSSPPEVTWVPNTPSLMVESMDLPSPWGVGHFPIGIVVSWSCVDLESSLPTLSTPVLLSLPAEVTLR